MRLHLKKSIPILGCIALLWNGSSNVQAVGISQETALRQLIESDLIIEESKDLLVELCQDADNVEFYLPDREIICINENLPCDNGSSEPYILISKTVDEYQEKGVFYKNCENILVALETLDGNCVASGQKYGIAASNTVNITWSYTDIGSLSDLKVKFNSMTAKYTYLPSQEREVSQMDYSASLQPFYGSYNYFQSASASNPASGIPYSKNLNSDWMLVGGDTVFSMITVHYSNGEESTYEGNLNIKH